MVIVSVGDVAQGCAPGPRSQDGEGYLPVFVFFKNLVDGFGVEGRGDHRILMNG
jgi:hypothetical protein